MTRQKITDADLGAFSDWHRGYMHSCYKFIDVDYLGYQIVYGEYVPYVAIERIRLRNDDPRVGPSEYPLHEHKRRVYESVATSLDIPAYTMWHNDCCDVFWLKRIDAPEPIQELRGANELSDFLDGLCRNQFGGLEYR